MLAQCAADFHGKKERYRKFLQVFEEYRPDAIILPGDLGRVDEEFLDVVDVKIYAVHGNMDGTLDEIKERVEFLDGRIVEIEGMKFMGIGDFYPENVSGRIDVIVSHIPPYRTKDRTFIGTHIGSKWLRRIMEETGTSYVLCGHVHEDAGHETFGQTHVINCSVGKRGIATLVDFEKGDIKMIGYL